MAGVALKDIWDAPITQSPPRSPKRASPAAPSSSHSPKRLRSTLFLDSDSDHDIPKQSTRKSMPPPEKSAIDAMFDNLDDDIPDLPPALNVEALRRAEDVKNAKTMGKSSPLDLTEGSKSKDDKENKATKERKKIPRLDEARLLGPDGFPALVKQAKNFVPKGRGHEATDLNRLLQVYQFWTHKMYPRSPFRETVQRVEKLCHSKRMNVALSVWRDEAHGVINGRPVDTAKLDDEDSDSSDEGDSQKLESHPKPDASSDGLDASEEHASSSRVPSQPPSSASELDMSDDFDIDAALREEEQQHVAASVRPPTSLFKRQSTYLTKEPPIVAADAFDEDEAMWDELMGSLPDDAMVDAAPSSRNPAVSTADANSVPITQANSNDDEDMWDIVREMEAEEASRGQQPSTGTEPPGTSTAPAPNPPSLRPTNEEGWDEMYL